MFGPISTLTFIRMYCKVEKINPQRALQRQPVGFGFPHVDAHDNFWRVAGNSPLDLIHAEITS
jgi:hypothetical protein